MIVNKQPGSNKVITTADINFELHNTKKIETVYTTLALPLYALKVKFNLYPTFSGCIWHRYTPQKSFSSLG